MISLRKASLYILLSSLVIIPVETALAQSSETLEEAAIFQFNPPDDGMPENTTGGASRQGGTCHIQQSTNQAAHITLLTPTSFVGLTVSAHPEFLLYAEQTPVEQIFVSIQDEQGGVFYQGFQSLPTDTGFFNVTLPEASPELELDKTYKISVVPICVDTLRPDDPILTGYIKRIALPSMVTPLSQASTIEIAQSYADAGVWYDTLVLLEQALSGAPEDAALSNAWNLLLTSGGFSNSNERLLY